MGYDKATWGKTCKVQRDIIIARFPCASVMGGKFSWLLVLNHPLKKNRIEKDSRMWVIVYRKQCWEPLKLHQLASSGLCAVNPLDA